MTEELLVKLRTASGVGACLSGDSSYVIVAMAQAANEIERLLAALGEAATYMQVCPPPDEAGDQLRAALQERRHRVLSIANEQKGD